MCFCSLLLGKRILLDGFFLLVPSSIADIVAGGFRCCHILYL